MESKLLKSKLESNFSFEVSDSDSFCNFWIGFNFGNENHLFGTEILSIQRGMNSDRRRYHSLLFRIHMFQCSLCQICPADTLKNADDILRKSHIAKKSNHQSMHRQCIPRHSHKNWGQRTHHICSPGDSNLKAGALLQVLISKKKQNRSLQFKLVHIALQLVCELNMCCTNRKLPKKFASSRLQPATSELDW